MNTNVVEFSSKFEEFTITFQLFDNFNSFTFKFCNKTDLFPGGEILNFINLVLIMSKQ